MISVSQFERLVDRFISSLISGITVSQETTTCTRHMVPDGVHRLRLTLTPRLQPQSVVRLERRQRFTEQEKAIIEHIVIAWADAFTQPLAENFMIAIARQTQLEVISFTVCEPTQQFVLTLLGLLVEWSSQTYEGERISFGIGVCGEDNRETPVSIMELFQEDFLKVITSDSDSLLVCTANGSILRHETLAPLLEPQENETLYAPISFMRIANWTEEHRYAFCLTQKGEILIFKNKELLFARRRGKWIFFTHNAYLDGMNGSHPTLRKDIRRAIYLTMLDVSFKRSGGCIGLWSDPDAHALIARNDLIGLDLTFKSRCLHRIIGKRKFTEMSRRFRQELVSIDGATVILHNGDILAVGAILNIKGGSSGGGRTAAAKTLAAYGMGAKISNDGKIEYWIELTDPAEPPKYEIG